MAFLNSLPLSNLVATGIVVSATACLAQTNSTWKSATPESQGMSQQKLEALKESLTCWQTKALLVIRNDAVVYEWYAPSHGPDETHYAASMSKALVGGVSMAVAITDGRVALDDKAAKYVSSWRNDALKSLITLRQLGSHTSGLEDAEQGDISHDKLTGWKGAFWKAGPPPNDPFTISRDQTPVVFKPGETNAYSNPGMAMLGYCLTVALREAPQKDLRTLLRDRIMRPAGVKDEDWSVG